MTWVEKSQPTPFDEQPWPGLLFLDGDMLARVVGRDWTRGQKLPVMVFPSGMPFHLWEAGTPEAGAIVHVFGEMDLPFKDTRDRAFEQASEVAEQVGYAVQKVGEDGLEVWGHDEDEHFLITYDPETGQMRDIVQVKDTGERPLLPAHQLMTDELRERLPGLGENEEQGLEAPALVKYFTPDGAWTWYGSEFDGDDVLFGLVVGLEIEFGYFSLSELAQVRGPLGLPVERDLYHEARSLRELQEQHERWRRGE